MREVIIETHGHDEWTSKVEGHEVNVRIVSCRPSGDGGMLQLVSINSGESVRKVLRAIKSHPNVIKSDMSLINDHRASGILVTKNSPLCRALTATNGFCSGCFFTQKNAGDGKWRILMAGKVSLDSFMRKLRKNGVSCTVRDVQKPERNDLLTFEQEKVMKYAESRGYYALPRTVGVRELSDNLGMAPSTLDEMLRRAERKVIENYMKDLEINNWRRKLPPIQQSA
ncbi:MAG: helix-turn-helix domain-containing protein [Nitrososphaerota archaeon]|nr:helix-turn-helix domain-containing protein [Nitrososphaerota archaeon]